MNPQALPIALSAGISVSAVIYTVTRPWRRLGPRVDAYTVASRNRLSGQNTQILRLVAPPTTASGALAGVFGPIAAAAARRVSGVLGHRDEAAVALALDQAGIRDITPKTYMYQQFAYAGLGLVGGGVLGLLGGTRFAVFLSILGCIMGALRKRTELDRRTRLRQVRMQSELVNICNLLAIYARATPNLQSVVATVCRRAHGEIVGELVRVLAAIEGGTAPEMAFARAAEITPEPAAAGLYRALALAITSGGDLADTLLSQAANLRDRYRDARKERATKRTQIIVASNASLLILPLLVLIGAGIPYMFLSKL